MGKRLSRGIESSTHLFGTGALQLLGGSLQNQCRGAHGTIIWYLMSCFDFMGSSATAGAVGPHDGVVLSWTAETRCLNSASVVADDGQTIH